MILSDDLTHTVEQICTEIMITKLYNCQVVNS